MNFKAQHGEDKWIEAHWSDLGLPPIGFFVEFGAGDGITYSNTYWLEKDRGWYGLLIEPDPRHVIEGREHCWVDRGAVVGPPGVISLGLTVDPFLSGEYRYSSHSREQALQVTERIQIESIPLTVTLKKYRIEGVDLLSVDTEGTEIEAWKTLDLKLYQPKVVIMEFLSWGWADRTNEVIKAMADDGYELLHTTGLNGIFKREATGTDQKLPSE